jgi:hypothetical protein
MGKHNNFGKNNNFNMSDNTKKSLEKNGTSLLMLTFSFVLESKREATIGLSFKSIESTTTTTRVLQF